MASSKVQAITQRIVLPWHNSVVPTLDIWKLEVSQHGEISVADAGNTKATCKIDWTHLLSTIILIPQHN
jgi:hypothetical protein